MMILNPVSQAQANLKEAERQLEHAKKMLKDGLVDQARIDELTRLKEAASLDLQRTIKEFGANIPADEQWDGNFRPY